MIIVYIMINLHVPSELFCCCCCFCCWLTWLSSLFLYDGRELASCVIRFCCCYCCCCSCCFCCCCFCCSWRCCCCCLSDVYYIYFTLLFLLHLIISLLFVVVVFWFRIFMLCIFCCFFFVVFIWLVPLLNCSARATNAVWNVRRSWNRCSNWNETEFDARTRHDAILTQPARKQIQNTRLYTHTHTVNCIRHDARTTSLRVWVCFTST